MNQTDPLLITLYAGVACSVVVAVVGLVLAHRLKAKHHNLSFLVSLVASMGMFAGVFMLASAIEAPTEITANEYAMLLTTLSARPELAKPFKASMRDGRVTQLELRRMRAGFPMVERDSMRGVAQIVARDLP